MLRERHFKCRLADVADARDAIEALALDRHAAFSTLDSKDVLERCKEFGLGQTQKWDRNFVSWVREELYARAGWAEISARRRSVGACGHGQRMGVGAGHT